MPEHWNKILHLKNRFFWIPSVYVLCVGKIKLLEATRTFKNTRNKLYIWCKIWVIIISVPSVQKITKFSSRSKYLKTKQHGCWGTLVKSARQEGGEERAARRGQGMKKDLLGFMGPVRFRQWGACAH